MFYEEITTKQDLFYISLSSLSILYKNEFILMATSLGTNAVVVTRVQKYRQFAVNVTTAAIESPVKTNRYTCSPYFHPLKLVVTI